MEGIRQSSKRHRDYLEEKDVEQIETQVRERIRKQHVKREARLDTCKHPRIKKIGYDLHKHPIYFCRKCAMPLTAPAVAKARQRGATVE